MIVHSIRKIKIFSIGLLLFIFMNNSSQADQFVDPVEVCLAKPELGKECVALNEAVLAREMADMIKDISLKKYQEGTVRRFNQPKTLGCLVAEFNVLSDIPEKLRVGIFKQPQMYKSMIRFANASEMDDREKDLRGMSIKVIGIEEASLWGNTGEQDFLLNSYPALFAANPAEFRDFIEASRKDKIWSYFANPLNPHLKSLWILFKARKKHDNPFQMRFWSTTPYRMGGNKTAVKYSVKPCSKYDGTSDQSHQDHLRNTMKQQLDSMPACFDFMVQKQNNADDMPIEDASEIWDETDAKFQTVARITIKNQNFKSESALDQCEKMTFNPWQSLAQHRPIGGINRVRKPIYTTIAPFRLTINQNRQ